MFNRLLFIFLMFIGLATAQAAARYEVELIAFKHYGAPNEAAEHLTYQLPIVPANQGINVLANLLPSESLPVVIDGAQVFSADERVVLLPKANFAMNTEMKRMIRSLAFTPLLHIGWSIEQGGSIVQAEDGSTAVRILAGKNFQGSYPLKRSQNGADLQGPLFELDGLITLNQEQNLYLETELVLREPSKYQGTATEASSKGSPELTEFPVKQRQLVIPGETYYLDHPLLGLLVHIKKI